jgi:hypothetical protein
VINKDKVSEKFDRFGLPKAIYDLKDDVPGVTDGDKLQKLINLSLQVWPNRESYSEPHLAHERVGLQVGPQMALLPEATWPEHTEAYVNHWYPKVNTKNQKAIADRMRHSVEVARRAYIKADSALICALDDPVMEDQEVTLKVPAVLKEDKVVVQKIKPKRQPAKIIVKKEEYFDPVDYGKKYRATNQATLKAKRQAKYQNEDNRFDLLRRKQVFALNAGYVKGVRKSTVTKYDLKQEDDGTWY